MKILALDIGTTKICGIVTDGETVIDLASADNEFLPPIHPWDRQQDPGRIFGIVRNIVSEFTKKYGSFRCIGVACQMHGILYVDASGRALSPFYTWQDQCASLAFSGGKSYAEYLGQFSSGRMAPGYGLASCFYHLKNNGIPPGATGLCGIGDYVVMRLCNSVRPLTHPTNAASFGFFDLLTSRFDKNAIKKAGLDDSLLPPVSRDRDVYGETAEGIPVCVSIGDNQASFLGAVRNPKESVSINIGTGSQISLVSYRPLCPGVLEARPFFGGLFLLVGASLCGGRAYAVLERFFRDVLAMAGFSGGPSLYRFMDALAGSKETLAVNTLFAGSRQSPSLRGSIQNISEDNFTPAGLITGFLHGIASELYSLYLPAREEAVHKILVGSGNGIRKNEPLKRILGEKFNMSLELPPYQEESAFGAALYARSCTEFSGSVLEKLQTEY